MVGKGWVEERTSEGMEQEGKSGDREDAGPGGGVRLWASSRESLMHLLVRVHATR